MSNYPSNNAILFKSLDGVKSKILHVINLDIERGLAPFHSFVNEKKFVDTVEDLLNSAILLNPAHTLSKKELKNIKNTYINELLYAMDDFIDTWERNQKYN